MLIPAAAHAKLRRNSERAACSAPPSPASEGPPKIVVVPEKARALLGLAPVAHPTGVDEKQAAYPRIDALRLRMSQVVKAPWLHEDDLPLGVRGAAVGLAGPGVPAFQSPKAWARVAVDQVLAVDDVRPSQLTVVLALPFAQARF